MKIGMCAWCAVSPSKKFHKMVNTPSKFFVECLRVIVYSIIYSIVPFTVVTQKRGAKKIFKCDKCVRGRCKSEKTLMQHMEKYHSHRCDIKHCGKSFASLAILKDHKQSIHFEECKHKKVISGICMACVKDVGFIKTTSIISSTLINSIYSN